MPDAFQCCRYRTKKKKEKRLSAFTELTPSSRGLQLSRSALLESIRVWMYRAEALHQSTSLGKNREVFLHKTTPESKAQARNSGAAIARRQGQEGNRDETTESLEPDDPGAVRRIAGQAVFYWQCEVLDGFEQGSDTTRAAFQPPLINSQDKERPKC